METPYIIRPLEGDDFVITIPKESNRSLPNELGVYIHHDYVKITGVTSITNSSHRKTHNTNDVPAKVSLTVNIRDFKHIILPLLLSHPYLSDSHFAERSSQNGETHPSYAYMAGIIHYIDPETNTELVAFRKVGEVTYSRVTKEIFEQIKGSLNLNR
jgi:hypothetical protein